MGKVGCGKSALIQALAGELHLRSGSMERNYSSLAYTAQDPWIMNGSIRDNIVMGKKWDKDWYQQVVDACGLRQDLQDFIYGDDTIVGDRGIQISGGQRARIGLARAFYRDAQVLLLDDPLSAIDSTLSRLIYQNAIQELGTKQGKCIIMATHEKQHVGPKDDCIILDGGSVAWNGPLDSEHSRLADEFRSSNPENTEIAFETKEKPVGKQMEEQKEKRGTGIVESTTWSAYGKALGGRAALLFLFMFFAITQSALLVLIVEVGNWAAASTDSQNTGYWLLVVLGMTAAVIVL
jgi:ATP-binding cassette subfamily C (CFTR/MRP) protein 4